MPNYIWFIFGILFWQLIFLIVAFVTHENEEIMTYFGTGFWMLPIIVFGIAYKLIRTWYIKHNYNGYKFVSNNNVSSTWIYISDRDIKKFNLDEDAQYHLRMYSIGTYWKSVPSRFELYRGQKYFNGWDMSKFKNNS